MENETVERAVPAAMPEAEHDRTVRAMFRVDKVEMSGDAELVKLSAACNDKIPLARRFHEASPSGDLSMYITNPSACGFLRPGKYYFLDFSLVPARMLKEASYHDIAVDHQDA